MSDTGHASTTFAAPGFAEPAPLSDNSIVLVRNLGAVVLRVQYAGQFFIANPGDQMALPWAAAVLWFGNPTLRDDPDGEASHRHRTKEAKRINLLWGMLNSPFYTNDPISRTAEDSHGDAVVTRPYVAMDDLTALGWTPPPGIAATYTHRHPNLPVIEVRHTSGSQALIHMVIDDPFGENDAIVQATVASSATNAATADLATKVSQQEAELAELKALMRTMAPSLSAALNPSSDDPTVIDPTAPGQDTTIHPSTPPEIVDPLSGDVAAVFTEERQASQRAKQRGGKMNPAATAAAPPVRPPSPSAS